MVVTSMHPCWGCKVKGGLKMKYTCSPDDVHLSEKVSEKNYLHFHSGEVGCNKL